MIDRNDDPHLSRSEWQAVSASLREVAKCGCGDGAGGWARGLARIARMLTGREEPQPLDDPRLEALRDFVCATERRRRRADEFVPDLLEHGFNHRQVEALMLLTI